MDEKMSRKSLGGTSSPIEDTESHYNVKIHPDTLEEQAPRPVRRMTEVALTFMGSYGWFILAVGVIFVYGVVALLPTFKKWKKEREDRSLETMAKKNPDFFLRRQHAFEESRKRFQNEYDVKAVVEAEKRKEKELAQRQEWLDRQGENVNRSGYRLGSSTTSESTEAKPRRDTGFKPEYNPLGGGSGSGSYRPPRRSCPGGGCG